MKNSHDPSKAIVSLRNFNVYYFKDSCYFVSKFELKYQQSIKECQKINNSNLFYLNNQDEIDHLWYIEEQISNLLKQNQLKNDHDDGTPDETQYHIGLNFDPVKKGWFWLNGVEFKESQFDRIKTKNFKIDNGFSSFLLFVTGKKTELSISQRTSSRKNFICRLSKSLEFIFLNIFKIFYNANLK